MYDDLEDMARNDPQGARALRNRLLSNLRLPSNFQALGDLIDGLGKSGFASRAAKLAGANDSETHRTTMLLNHALSLVVLDELLWQFDARGSVDTELVPVDEDDPYAEETADVMATINEFGHALPGLISHYDSLGVRNTHDHLILQCLKLGFLQANPHQ